MADQADFIREVRAAVDDLFAYRKALRRVQVRCGFWPEGLVIEAFVVARNKIDLLARGREIVPWERLPVMDGAELSIIVERVCEPARRYLERAAS